MKDRRKTSHNSTYPKVAVQLLNQALCFYQNLCLIDSEVLRNRHLRVAAKRCATFYKKTEELKKIGILLIIILLLGCSSNRNMNKIYSQLNCNKTIHIVWDESNNFTRIESVGTFKNDYASFAITKGKKLNYKETFKKSLEELNKKYKTKFVFKEHHGFVSDSIIQVTIKIDKIIWNKGYSNAVMDNYLVYKTKENNVQIIGKSKAQSYAKAGKSLLQSFEHGNLLFLLSACED